MNENFRVSFNRNQQYFGVFLWEVHPKTFKSWGGGNWAYYDLETIEHPRRGRFGDIHFVASRVRVDTVSHELDHLRCAWMFRGWKILTPNNEEWFCTFGDELTRKFWREYKKYEMAYSL